MPTTTKARSGRAVPTLWRQTVENNSKGEPIFHFIPGIQDSISREILKWCPITVKRDRAQKIADDMADDYNSIICSE